MKLNIKNIPLEAALNAGGSSRLLESETFISNGHWIFMKKHIEEILPVIRSCEWEKLLPLTDEVARKVIPEIVPGAIFEFCPTRFMKGYEDQGIKYVTDGYTAFDKSYYWFVTEHMGMKIYTTNEKRKRRSGSWNLINDNNIIVGAIMPASPDELARIWREEDRKDKTIN